MDIAIQHPWFRRALGSVYPARLFDQFFGEGMFDYDLFPYAASTISPYYRQSLFRNVLDFSNSGISEVRSDRDKFTVYLDVKHFSPDELSVKVTDDYVEIQGKHGERQVVLLSDQRSSGFIILWYLLEGLKVLQGLQSSQSQAWLHAGSEPADASTEVWIQERGAQQEQHVVL
uniref:Alpha-crystallin A chain n=1 Tax=Neolamprologus brichardi TaxID=32507 RepID=A0A3Q4HFV3_NEOBR